MARPAALVLLMALALSGGVGCATIFTPARFASTFDATVEIPDSSLPARVHMHSRDAAFLWSSLVPALGEAATRLEPWGVLKTPVDIWVYADHDGLAGATLRYGRPWMVGNGAYAVIKVQSPRSWKRPDWRKSFNELLTHELAHVLMNQTACPRWKWWWCGYPLWFKEGFASNVAQQGWRRTSRTELRRYYLSSGYIGDPLTRGASLIAGHPGMVYGAGHHAVADLISVCPPPRLRAIFEATLRKGESFRTAFTDVVGVTPGEFLRRWRGDLLAEQRFASYGGVGLCAGSAKPNGSDAHQP